MPTLTLASSPLSQGAGAMISPGVIYARRLRNYEAGLTCKITGLPYCRVSVKAERCFMPRSAEASRGSLSSRVLPRACFPARRDARSDGALSRERFFDDCHHSRRAHVA